MASSDLAFSYANVPSRSPEYETTSMPHGTSPVPMVLPTVKSRFSNLCPPPESGAEAGPYQMISDMPVIS